MNHFQCVCSNLVTLCFYFCLRMPKVSCKSNGKIVPKLVFLMNQFFILGRQWIWIQITLFWMFLNAIFKMQISSTAQRAYIYRSLCKRLSGLKRIQRLPLFTLLFPLVFALSAVETKLYLKKENCYKLQHTLPCFVSILLNILIQEITNM